ncbi:MAG: hypothetical protein AAF212_03555 [Verrucomicrobiota bacterium]
MNPTVPTDSAPWLVLDASHPTVEIGIIGANGWLAHECAGAPALSSLFDLTKKCFQTANLSLDKITSYVQCMGPGSILGIRLTAMAIKTWRGIYPNTSCLTYTSLDLARRSISLRNSEEAFRIVTDWKRNAWHLIESDDRTITSIDTETLSSSTGQKTFYLTQRKSWESPPLEVTEIQYSIKALPRILSVQSDVLTQSTEPGLFQHHEPVYQKWGPSRHGKDSATRA